MRKRKNIPECVIKEFLKQSSVNMTLEAKTFLKKTLTKDNKKKDALNTLDFEVVKKTT